VSSKSVEEYALRTGISGLVNNQDTKTNPSWAGTQPEVDVSAPSRAMGAVESCKFLVKGIYSSCVPVSWVMIYQNRSTSPDLSVSFRASAFPLTKVF
jgi:hypothetical protein